MTSRLSYVDPANATGRARELLDGVKAKLGRVPNAMKAMVNAPAVFEGYLSFTAAMSKGVLPATVREQIALVVSQANRCEYCVSAHSLTAKLAGLNPEQILNARRGKGTDPKAHAVLNLAQNVLERRGDVSDQQLADARQAGLTDTEVTEVVGNVVLISLMNYFNQFARPDNDFPHVSLALPQ